VQSRKIATLILEGNGTPGLNLDGLLHFLGFSVARCDRKNLQQHFQTMFPDLVIVGSCEKPAWEGVELAKGIRQINGNVPIVMLTAESSEKLAISALKAGVNDYFSYPFSHADLMDCFRQYYPNQRSGERAGAPKAGAAVQGPDLIGSSRLLETIKTYISKIAPQDSTVLITGDSGTGKQVVADLIHQNSQRRGKPFICINCAAIPDELFESELYGYERGAFTGAVASKPGKLELADGGTIFLDEIGDLSPYAQAKFLRTIETKEVSRLGGKKTSHVDVRIIAATNRDLEAMMKEGKFREDLYFRLNIGRIHLSPLKERREDIAPLLKHFLQEMNQKFNRRVQGFSEEAFSYLVRYDWPGNVRELKNILEATFPFLGLPGHKIEFADLPEIFQRRLTEASELPSSERERLIAALYATNWNKTKAALSLNWSRMTLYRKMSKYKLISNVEAQEDEVAGAPCNRVLNLFDNEAMAATLRMRH
jgi:DNA-binding NtrC family response regulator